MVSVVLSAALDRATSKAAVVQRLSLVTLQWNLPKAFPVPLCSKIDKSQAFLISEVPLS